MVASGRSSFREDAPRGYFDLVPFRSHAPARGKLGCGLRGGWCHRYLGVRYRRDLGDSTALNRTGGSAIRKLLIWVAALLVIDFDDLVGRVKLHCPATG